MTMYWLNQPILIYSDILTLYNLANMTSTKAKDPHYYVHHLMKERKNQPIIVLGVTAKDIGELIKSLVYTLSH